MSINLTNDPRVRGRAVAEIRASLRAPDQVAYLERRVADLMEEAYGESSPMIERSTGRVTAGRAPRLASRNLAAVLGEFADAIKPNTRPFMRAFEPPPPTPSTPERRPRRYRSQ